MEYFVNIGNLRFIGASLNRQKASGARLAYLLTASQQETAPEPRALAPV
jgi:hypothetical protein